VYGGQTYALQRHLTQAVDMSPRVRSNHLMKDNL